VKLSLSVRIVESADKTRLSIPLDELLVIAKDLGYSAVCMRASAAGIGASEERLAAIRRQVQDLGLVVSMVTADFNVPLNNEHGPDALRNIGPTLDVAQALGCDLVRVCLKRRDDIPYARQAAQAAAKRGIRLAHQCHTATIFEEVQPMLDVLKEIGQRNFGIIYEPANLYLCGQSYGPETLAKLRPWLMNVYVQNHKLDSQGPVALTTYCRDEVRFHHLDPWESGGVDFAAVFAGLKEIGYQGHFTIHQAQGIQTAREAKSFAGKCADWFRKQARP